MSVIEFNGSIALITIDNPPQNYLQHPDFVGLDKLQSALAAQECKAVVIKGSGRHFSGGADVEELKNRVRENTIADELRKGKELLRYLRSLNIPLIAAIEGVCFGGGLEIALNCDIRLASDKALFAFPEVNLDLLPGMGGSWMLPGKIGKAKSMEMLLSGDVFDAQTALELQLVDELCPPKSCFAQASKLARKMTGDRPLHVINAIVEAVRNASERSYEEALERETQLFCQLARKAFQDE
jgi:enoyl-CoA hydratase/carnithine racemase